jgi:hypothetical protein
MITIRRKRKSPPMVPLEAAARRLGIELDALVRRLALRDIVIVGRGHRARITEADLDRVRAAVLPFAEEPP